MSEPQAPSPSNAASDRPAPPAAGDPSSKPWRTEGLPSGQPSKPRWRPPKLAIFAAAYLALFGP